MIVSFEFCLHYCLIKSTVLHTTPWGFYCGQAGEMNFYGDEYTFNLLKIAKFNNRDMTTALFEVYGKFTKSVFINLFSSWTSPSQKSY